MKFRFCWSTILIGSVAFSNALCHASSNGEGEEANIEIVGVRGAASFPKSLRQGAQRRISKQTDSDILESLDVEYKQKDDGSGGRRRVTEGMTCILSVAEVLFVDGEAEDVVLCEVSAADLPDGKTFCSLEIKFLPEDVVGEIQSGKTIFRATSAIIDDSTAELTLPAGASYEVSDEFVAGGGDVSSGDYDDSSRRHLAVSTTGNKSVLIIREKRTTSTAADISDSVFGTSGDLVTLSSQYAACSDNQLTFSKYRGNSKVKDGVLTVSVPQSNVIGASAVAISAEMLNQAAMLMGTTSLFDLVDYVMVCNPNGTEWSRRNKWSGFATMRGQHSVYNDDDCEYSELQMHEFGHSFDMGHSGKDRKKYMADTVKRWFYVYLDESGLMGGKPPLEENVLMCFNGPKTYRFGWYKEYHVDLSGSTIFWRGTLVGFAEKNALADGDSDKMILRITSSNSREDDYYVNFNRKIGMNADTKEGGDQVMVTARPPDDYLRSPRDQSWLEAKLSEGGKFSVPDFQGSGKSLTITVDSIMGGTPRRATVTVQLGNTEGPPPVQAPTGVPTKPPNQAPTKAPVPPPPTSTMGIVSQFVIKHAGKCMGVAESSIANGGLIQQWECLPNAANQFFETVPVNGGFMLKAIHSGKCITVPKSSQENGVSLDQYDCLGAPNQVMTWSGSSLKFKHSNKCINVYYRKRNDGAQIVQHRCMSGRNEQFTLLSSNDPPPVQAPAQAPVKAPTNPPVQVPNPPVNSSTELFQYEVKHSRKCMVVADQGTGNGVLIHQFECLPRAANQFFETVPVDGGGFMLKASNSGKCITVPNGSTQNGLQLEQYDCYGAPHQILNWRGSSLQFQHSDMCINVHYRKRDNRASIVQHHCRDGRNEQFNKVPFPG